MTASETTTVYEGKEDNSGHSKGKATAGGTITRDTTTSNEKDNGTTKARLV